MFAGHLYYVKMRPMKDLDDRTGYHHGDLREALLAAAQELLRHGDAAAVTLRAVAKAAGVSHTAPYHHFPSLEALLAAVAARGFDDLAAAMQGAQEPGDPGATLVGQCVVYVAFARARPGLFRCMFGPLLQRKASYPELAQASEMAFRLLLASAQAWDPGRGGAVALAGWSLAHGVANLAIDGSLQTVPVPVPDAEVLARQLSLLLLHQVPGPAGR